MKAIVCTKYGPAEEVLELRELPRPVPKDRELLIKIHSTAVTASDVLMRGLDVPWIYRTVVQLMMGFGKPRKPVLGMSFSGTVESTGSKVTRFAPGDAVVGYGAMGPTSLRFGSYAEYHCLPEDWVVVSKPDAMSFEDAAALPYGGLLAWHYFKDFELGVSSHALIYGASGSIGTASVQLAKLSGARVTAVCSASNHELVKSLGADEVLDYTDREAAFRLKSYDLVFDAAGKSKTSALKEKAKKSLNPHGRYVSVDDETPAFAKRDLAHLVTLAAEKKYRTIIDKTYPLTEMVQAHQYVEKGHKRGNVLVRVAGESFG